MIAYELVVENALRNGAPFEYSMELDGEEFFFNFEYNRRIDTWFITITTADESISIGPNPIMTSIFGMFRRYQFDQILPTGDIAISDKDSLYANSGRGLDPSLENFGFGKKLNYYSIGPEDV